MRLCSECGEAMIDGWEHVCDAAPTRPPRRKDSLDESEPPEEGSYHTFVGRMEYRADRRETRAWREGHAEWQRGNEARLQRIEKRLTVVGLVIAAATAASNGAVPWERIAQALGW